MKTEKNRKEYIQQIHFESVTWNRFCCPYFKQNCFNKTRMKIHLNKYNIYHKIEYPITFIIE